MHSLLAFTSHSPAAGCQRWELLSVQAGRGHTAPIPTFSSDIAAPRCWLQPPEPPMSLHPLLLWAQPGSRGVFCPARLSHAVCGEKRLLPLLGEPGGVWRGAAAPRSRGRQEQLHRCCSVLRANQELPLAGLQ